jgi:hypothetical protein
MFLFRNKKIVVDAFTNYAEVHQHFSIQRSTNHYPDWWKALPKTYETKTFHNVNIELPTTKTCVGIINYFKNSFTMPLWSDVVLQTEEDGSYVYEFSARNSLGIETHPKSQYGHEFDNYIHMKFLAPWVLTEKTGVNFLAAAPTWNLSQHLNDIHILPGIIDFKYQYAMHVNMFLPKKQNRIFLESEMPFLNLIPLTEKEVEFRTHLISNEEFVRKQNITGATTSFIRKYFKNKKRMETQNRSGCPFTGFMK